jgi:D-3-phosphoglycerate dehydrogenase
MQPKVLITDAAHELLMEGLARMGYACDYWPDITPQETKDGIAAYEGLVINSKILVDKAFLDKAERLRFVARLGSGMEIVDKAYAATKGVIVLSSPEGNRNAVAEQALGMLLALANNLLVADAEVRQKIWQREKNRGFEIMGKTIGIVGFGHTGSTFAKKLTGMEMHVLAYDKYKQDYTASFPYVEETSLSHLQAEADIISFHLPLTAETRALVDTAFLANCKKGAIVINTSRGQVVQTQALVDALESGQVGGACLDVFENEKPPTFSAEEDALFKRLYAFENVVLSPHIAGWTHESKRRMAEVLLEKIAASVHR